MPPFHELLFRRAARPFACCVLPYRSRHCLHPRHARVKTQRSNKGPCLRVLRGLASTLDLQEGITTGQGTSCKRDTRLMSSYRPQGRSKVHCIHVSACEYQRIAAVVFLRFPSMAREQKDQSSPHAACKHIFFFSIHPLNERQPVDHRGESTASRQ